MEMLILFCIGVVIGYICKSDVPKIISYKDWAAEERLNSQIEFYRNQFKQLRAFLKYNEDTNSIIIKNTIDQFIDKEL